MTTPTNEANVTRRVPAHQRVRHNVVRNDRPGRHHCVFPDNDAAANCGIRADAGMVEHQGALNLPRFSDPRPPVIREHHMRADEDPIRDRHPVVDGHVVLHVYAVAQDAVDRTTEPDHAVAPDVRFGADVSEGPHPRPVLDHRAGVNDRRRRDERRRDRRYICPFAGSTF